MRQLFLMAAGCIAVAISGCRTDRSEESGADTAAAADTVGAAPAQETAAASSLADPQIAHVAVTANSIDSAAGQLARKNGQSAAVKDFGQTMIIDHTAMNTQAADLAKKLNLTPADNDVSRQLQQDADKAHRELGKKRGAEFDRAYIDREVAYHQAVLDALDKTLIPGAQNAELKKLLQQVRPAVAAHLKRAQQLQGKLGSQ